MIAVLSVTATVGDRLPDLSILAIRCWEGRKNPNKLKKHWIRHLTHFFLSFFLNVFVKRKICTILYTHKKKSYVTRDTYAIVDVMAG